MPRLSYAAVTTACLLAVMSSAACTPVGPTRSTYVDPNADIQSGHPELPSAASEPEVPATPSEPDVVASGAVHTPAVGSAERTALMNAARGALGVSSKFEVLQLASDGAWALGVLKPVGSKSVHAVAFRQDAAAGWNAYWTGTTAQAAAGAVSTADARLPGPVLAAVNMAAAPKKKSTSTSSSSGIPTKAEFVRMFLAEAEQGAGPARMTHLQRSSGGVWWGAGTYDGPVDGGYFIVVQRRRGGWDFIDCGSSGPEYDGLLETIPGPMLDEMRRAGAVW